MRYEILSTDIGSPSLGGKYITVEDSCCSVVLDNDGSITLFSDISESDLNVFSFVRIIRKELE